MSATGTEFSIAVLGAMNPAIHTPDWYHFLGLIDEAELAASKGPSLTVTQVVAQFSISAFTIICTEAKWVIRARENEASRATDVAKQVFKTLDHTPVSAYGVNLATNYETDDSEFRERLKHGVGQLLDQETELKTCSINYSVASNDTGINVTLRPSDLAESQLLVTVNYHHPAPSHEWRHFELGGLLEDAVAQARLDHPNRCKQLAEAFIRSGKE